MRITTGLLGILLMSTVAGAAPLTVKEHTIQAKVDSSVRLATTVTWTVVIDDPAACTAGIEAPKELEGAKSDGATVIDGKFACPPETEAATEFTLKKTVKQRRGPYNVIFATSPGAQRTVINTVVPTWVAQGVWHNNALLTEYTSRGGYGVKHTWNRNPQDTTLRAAFSTYKDWTEAAKPFDSALKYKISKASDLGALGTLTGREVGDIATEVYKALPLADGVTHTWTQKDLRKARDIVAEPGAGVSPTERALVLVAALRAAGFDASPALFDANPAYDDIPINLPLPARFTEPAVAVVVGTTTVWIDPTAIYAAIPDPSESMAGRPAWRIGDGPVRVTSNALDHGEIAIDGTVILGATAHAVALNIQANGRTREMLRKRFGGLDDAARIAIIQEYAGEGRLSDVTFESTGLDGVGSQVHITLTGTTPTQFEPFGMGATGVVSALLAPGFAAALPAEMRVRESLMVTAPEGMQFVTSNPTSATLTPSVLINHQLTGSAQEMRVVTVIDRLIGDESAELSEALAAEVTVGPDLMVMPSPNGKVIRSVKKLVEGTDRWVSQATLWYAAENSKKGGRMLKKAAKKATVAEMLSSIEKYSLEGDAEVWVAFYRTLETESDKLLVLEAMERKGLRRSAWQFATLLTRSEDSHIRRQSYMAILRLQGDKPDPAVDKEAANAWIPPKKLVKAAWKEAQSQGVKEPELYALQIEELVVNHRLFKARETLESAEEEGMSGPLAELLLAELDGMESAVIADVVDAVTAAAEQKPMDSEIWRHAARAVSGVGEDELAIEYAARAARLAFDEPERWIEVLDYSLKAGDLSTGLQAAVRASDQFPAHRLSGIRLKLAALFAGDLELSNVGARRGKQGEEFELPTLSVMLDQAGDDAALALLNHHDAAVIGDPDILFTRAEFHLQEGNLEAAARDGMVLARKYRSRDGEGILFAATAGSYWAPAGLKALGGAVSRSPLARRIRMEWALISGSSDPRSDAYNIRRTDNKAQILIDSRSKPDTVAARIDGWEVSDGNIRIKSPPGYRSNYTLTGPKGVTALSDKIAGEAILFLKPALGLVPGPVGVMFEQPDQPIRTLLSGANLYRLRGTRMPIYAAVLYRDEGDLIGYGTTEAGASHALKVAEKHAPVDE